MSTVDKLKWEQAMQSKMDSLIQNDTWELTPLPEGKKALPCKWVYKIKMSSMDAKPKCKARLVAKGFKQQKGIDFDEIFSPMVKMTTLRTLLALVATKDMELKQMDVKKAFLHKDLHEDLYMEQPAGDEDPCLYTCKAMDGSLIVLVLYVDDMLIARKSMVDVDALKHRLHETFAMKDLGDASHIFGYTDHS
ncbi:hypothetical protein L7F22_020826 [Adiantum nelumboides]|nr:hypothetical protein [Adiantum nelumboides]